MIYTLGPSILKRYFFMIYKLVIKYSIIKCTGDGTVCKCTATVLLALAAVELCEE
jgi:hypothetical protein